MVNSQQCLALIKLETSIMNTKQLHKFCVQNPITNNKFKGVIAKNHLPNELKNGFIIVNTDNCHQPGQHWVVIWVKTTSVNISILWVSQPKDALRKLF